MNAVTPTPPATAPVISDELLARLATPEPGYERGEISADTQAMLVLALPEIARELLARRAARPIPEGALCIALRPEAIETRLRKAREAIRSSRPLSPRELVAHATVLSIHSHDPLEVQAAFDVLDRQTEGDAA